MTISNEMYEKITNNLYFAHEIQRSNFRCKIDQSVNCYWCGGNHKEEVWHLLFKKKYSNRGIVRKLAEWHPYCAKAGWLPSEKAVRRYKIWIRKYLEASKEIGFANLK